MFGFGKKKEEENRLSNVLSRAEMKTVKKLLAEISIQSLEKPQFGMWSICNELTPLVSKDKPLTDTQVMALLTMLETAGQAWGRPELTDMAMKIAKYL